MAYCAICKERWKSLRAAHCTGCHRTFRSVGAFEKHRKDLQCRDPLDIGMKMDERGFWMTPMSEEWKKRRDEGSWLRG